MIIDYSFFTGKLNLPQTGNTEGRNLVDEFIETYETEYLKKSLGYELWKAFADGTEGSGDPDQRWKDLLEGKEFEHNDRLYEWIGFEKKPIQNYVYYKLLENEASNTTLIGEVSSNADNSKRVSFVSKMISAWNEMVVEDLILYRFLCANESIYPEWHKEMKDEVFHFKNSLDL
jgi:hypothetical protein